VIVWGGHSCPPAARQSGALASGSLIQVNSEKMWLPHPSRLSNPERSRRGGHDAACSAALDFGGTTDLRHPNRWRCPTQRRLQHRSIAHMIYMVVRWRGIGNQWNAVLRMNWSNICRTFGALRRRRALPRSKRLRPHGLSALPSLW
jgi:hypothetical protein